MEWVNDRTIRLALAADNTMADGLWCHPLIKAGGGDIKRRERTIIHCDTPNLGLRQRGLALTLEQHGKKWMQTLVSPAGKQLACKLSGPEPNHKKLGSKGKKLLRKIPAREIGTLFTEQVTSSVCHLSFPDGSRLLLGEERGAWLSGDAKAPFHHVTIIMEKGHPGRLYQTALSLAYAVQPALVCASPSELGLFTLDPTLPRAYALEPVRLKSGMNAERAFILINGGLLRRILANQCAARFGTGDQRSAAIRAIDQGVGELRVMVALYDTLLPSDIRDELDSELKWLRGELAEARAWEKFIVGTLEPFIAHFPGYTSLGGLREAAQQRLAAALARLESALDSFRFTRLCLGLASWLSGQGWRELMDQPQRQEMDRGVTRLARESLDRHHHQMRREGKPFAELDQEGRRQLAHSGDLLAEACAAFSGLFGKRGTAYQSALDTLREELHPLREVDAAYRLFNEILPGEEEALVHLINGYLGSREERRMQDSFTAWETFVKHPAYWS